MDSKTIPITLFDSGGYIPKCMLGTLETTFHGQQTICSVGESLSWSEMPYFKEGPLRMVP